MKHILFAAATLAIATMPALAQQPDLPPVCLADAGHAGHGMAGGHGGGMAGAAMPHPDLMAGMDQMNADMMAGATARDLDVAFVCSMIPHHRGAIEMAQAELAGGDDPFARELAERIIAAQEAEIAEMLAWLETQAK